MFKYLLSKTDSIAWLFSLMMVPCGETPQKEYSNSPMSQGESELHDQMVSLGMKSSVTIAQLLQETRTLWEAIGTLQKEKKELFDWITKKKKISQKEYEEIRIKSKKINKTFNEVAHRYSDRFLDYEGVSAKVPSNLRAHFMKFLLMYTMRGTDFLPLTFEWREWKDYFVSEEMPYPDFIEAEKLLEREKERQELTPNVLEGVTRIIHHLTVYPTQSLEERKKMVDDFNMWMGDFGKHLKKLQGVENNGKK